MTLKFWSLMFAASLFLYSVFVLASVSVSLWRNRRKPQPPQFHLDNGYTSDARERARLDLVTRLNGRG